MSILVRKITRSKWQELPKDNDVNADAITLCCRTSSNTLSVWQVNTEVDADVDLAVLAMVAGQDHLDKMDLVLIPESEIVGKIAIVKTPGLTPVKSLVNTHRDLSNLTYKTLGFVKDCIAQRLQTSATRRYTASQLKKLLLKGIDGGLISKSDLNEKLQKQL
jgi:hypothetical protein